MISLLNPRTIKDKKVLAFSAHPDDVEFGAGGTLLQLAQNNQVTLVIATDGKMGTHDLDADKGEVAKVRQTESQLAGEKLGVKRTVFWNYPDLGLRDWRKHLFKKTLKFLLRHRPHIIISTDPWARYEIGIHPDHRLLAEVVLEAVLCGTLPLFLARKGFDRQKPLTPKPQVWLMFPEEVNQVVDVTSEFDQKLQALKSFTSQYDRQIQWPKKAAWVKNLAVRAAALTQDKKIKFAEGFRVIDNNF